MALLSGPNCVISGSSTDPALRVTQTGGGVAIRVEDSTNPDVSPFVVATNGSVGIGTANPQRQLHIVEDTSDEANILLGRTTAAVNETIWRMYVANDDNYRITALNDAVTAECSAYLIQRGTGTTIAGHTFFTGGPSTGGAPDARLRITSGGNVGINTVSPLRQLHVAGATEANVILDRQAAAAGERLWRILIPDGNSNLSISAPNDDLSSAQSAYVIGRGSGAVVSSHTWYVGGSAQMTLASNGYVGIGNTNPGRQLVIEEDVSGESNILLSNVAAAANEKYWRLYRTNADDFILSTLNDAITAESVAYGVQRGTGLEILRHTWGVGGDPVTGASTTVMVMNNQGTLRLGGGNPTVAGLTGGLEISNSAAVPTGNPSGGGVIYVEAGALKYRGSGGTVTTLAPA